VKSTSPNLREADLKRIYKNIKSCKGFWKKILELSRKIACVPHFHKEELKYLVIVEKEKEQSTKVGSWLGEGTYIKN